LEKVKYRRIVPEFRFSPLRSNSNSRSKQASWVKIWIILEMADQ